MSTPKIVNLSPAAATAATTDTVDRGRRSFLKTSAGAAAGLTLGVWLPARGQMAGAGRVAGPGMAGGEPAAAGDFAPNAFVRIGTDDSVTVVCKHLEMGQGTFTGLPTLVAEELDARWEQVQPVGAPVDNARYNNLFWGQVQGTGGSTAIANAYEQMRRAGAAARGMLVGAAAEQWQVPAAEITVVDGVVSHPKSGRSAGFGELAEAAAAQPVPEAPTLKDPSAFKLIGKAFLPRKDSKAKCTGVAQFTQDVRLPGMLTACVAHPPLFGAKVRGFDDSAARAVPGVEQVVQIPSGVAVLAYDFWSAQQGRDALTVDWDESGAFTQGSAEILADYRKLAERPGKPVTSIGDAEQALAGAETVIEAEYSVPFLAHAAMETMDCVITPDAGGGVRVINGEQFQTIDQQAVAGVLGLEPSQVRIEMLYAGGSFGRRANPQSDYLVEAAHIFKAAGGKTPVKLIWTREDDTRAGFYRPLYLHRLKAGLDASGKPVAWQHRIVGQSIITGTAFEPALVVDGVDQTSVEGAKEIPYAIPNQAVDLHSPQLPVTVQWWRAVGSTHTAFAVECMLDELAAAAGKDPVDFRVTLMGEHPRERDVLKLAAQRGGWYDPPLPDGRGRGIAVHKSFGSYVAMVAEVTLDGDDGFSVDRVVIAVDCGTVVNPDVVVAQMEGGMGFGLSAALMSEITLVDGAVQQSNFDDYLVLRMDRMPAVEVHLVPSTEAPTGVGEPATPVIAPAVANALAAATGRRFHRLPLKRAA
ncbi:xanthine dehydrogenase family protein molybdopterin-binding subunit [uncultured Thiohalocapsa sp.]|uniref:xanthine dehydrogenase family protein molybdopterin-binding subunit n=1 Tax=uncultured Thiohalocapsa sp. TaxID=768990 RepID=UPI0025D77BFD|nr:xanthine dehydrogenase family protein molybdopterin-binding subunit [uncultured Thiohalocapsa sp.]